MQQIQYYRNSVCAGDDYVNCDQTIEMSDDALLEDLVTYIMKTHFGNYSFIPYTGGNALWALESNAGILAIVCDDGEQVSYPTFDSKQPLNTIGVTSIFGRRQ